jgi:ADP-ribose pyrophosphatase YjhB (NUDIX family)
VDCIKREAMEELGQEIEVLDHFYTTGFFQQSAFHTNQQILSIYYLVKLTSTPNFPAVGQPFENIERSNGSIVLRWIDLFELNEKHVTLPIDRHVVTLIRKNLL